MKNTMKNKRLLKILIGTAWIDGVIQTQERDYLRQVATREDLSDDAEIAPLLSELKPVPAIECYQWIEEYLGDNTDESAYQELLESLSALIYSDGEVGVQEAKLLTKVQSLDPGTDPLVSPLDKLVAKIRKLYAQAIAEKNG
jgi:uncharacterized tellurite resistance protein B-like protein